MKSILISIKPKWCALTMNDIKKIEVRKNKALASAIQKLIDEYGYADIYVYCTKGNEDIVRVSSPYSSVPNYTCVKIDKKLSKDLPEYEYSSRGKVIFKFRCYKVEKIKLPYTLFGTNEWVKCEAQRTLQTETLDEKDLLKLSCLEDIDFYTYLNFKNSPNNVGCAIHINDLEIFDRPRELWQFEKVGSYNNPTIKCKKKEQGRCNYGKSPFTGKWVGCEKARLTKAPQNYVFIEVD